MSGREQGTKTELDLPPVLTKALRIQVAAKCLRLPGVIRKENRREWKRVRGMRTISKIRIELITSFYEDSYKY